MQVQRRIEDKLRSALSPSHLEVVNESYRHSVPPGSESHFKVVVVSDGFAGQPLVRRHQAVNRILAEELRGGVHALALQTLTGGEWAERHGAVPDSPACLGGGKADRRG